MSPTRVRKAPEVSHAYAAVQVCIIGAGKMSRLLVKHLASKGLQRLTLLNRSLPRCAELQAEFPEVEFDVRLMPDLMQCVEASDTIFAASGSEDILVRAADLAGAAGCSWLLHAHGSACRDPRVYQSCASVCSAIQGVKGSMLVTRYVYERFPNPLHRARSACAC